MMIGEVVVEPVGGTGIETTAVVGTGALVKEVI